MIVAALTPRNDSRDANDLQAGDCVRRYGRIGIVESDPEHGFVWVVWKSGRRDYLPVSALRLIDPGGSEYDVRRK